MNAATPRHGLRRGLVVALAVAALSIAAAWHWRALLAAAVRQNPVPPSADSLARGRALWQLDCEACHGPQGAGDGPVTAALAKKPKDLTRIARPPVFPDGVLAYRIATGGEVMPAWLGTLSDADIWDLVNYIRAQRR